MPCKNENLKLGEKRREEEASSSAAMFIRPGLPFAACSVCCIVAAVPLLIINSQEFHNVYVFFFEFERNCIQEEYLDLHEDFARIALHECDMFKLLQELFQD